LKITHGDKIATLRRKYNMTQLDLSTKLGIDRACLSLIENDKRNLLLDEAVLVCDIFNLSLDNFIGKNRSVWVILDGKNFPADDENCLICWKLSNGKYSVPHKVYFDKEEGKFFSMEGMGFAVIADIYMLIPEISL